MTNGVLGLLNTNSIGNNLLKDITKTGTGETESFASILKNTISDSLNTTQNLIDAAEEAEIQFALGNSDNTHDLEIAQQKANLALSYTVAVRDRLLEAYKEIMNMQI